VERLLLSDEAELAFVFSEILKRKKDAKLLKINKIFLPIVAIQGEPNHHLIFDNIGINKLDSIIGNAPRQAQVGATMRKTDIDLYDRLKQAFDILSFKTTILDQSTDLTEEEKQSGETRNVSIAGLFSPEILAAMEKLIPLRYNDIIKEDHTLTSKFEYDAMVNLSEKYRKLLSEITGYIARWAETKRLVEEPVNRWILDYNASVKDLEERFRSERNKAESMICEKSKEIQMDSIKNQMENWVFNAKKNIIGKMGGFFKPVELTVEKMLKKNKEMLNIEQLQTKDPMDVLKMAYMNIASMRDEMAVINETLTGISARLASIQTDLENTELSAEERIKKIDTELSGKMEMKNKLLDEVSQKEQEAIQKLQEKRAKIEEIKTQIFKYIDERVESCNRDLEYIREWQIKDTKTHISNPFANMFLTAYLATVEDEDDEDEEILHLLMPCKCGKDLQWKPIVDGVKYEEKAFKVLQRDMKIRTNFEFVSMKNNMMESPDFKEKVKKGLLQLVKQNLCSEEKKEGLIAELNKM